jgi:hypothetical protein
MSMARVNAINRVLLALIGLILLAAGVGGLLLSFVLIANGTGLWLVIPDLVVDFVTSTSWLPWAAAVAAGGGRLARAVVATGPIPGRLA